jgi:hypothetical protein
LINPAKSIVTAMLKFPYQKPVFEHQEIPRPN